MNNAVPLERMRLVSCDSTEATAAERAEPKLYCGCVVEGEWNFCEHASRTEFAGGVLRAQTTRAKHRTGGGELVYWMKRV